MLPFIKTHKNLKTNANSTHINCILSNDVFPLVFIDEQRKQLHVFPFNVSDHKQNKIEFRTNFSKIRTLKKIKDECFLIFQNII